MIGQIPICWDPDRDAADSARTRAVPLVRRRLGGQRRPADDGGLRGRHAVRQAGGRRRVHPLRTGPRRDRRRRPRVLGGRLHRHRARADRRRGSGPVPQGGGGLAAGEAAHRIPLRGIDMPRGQGNLRRRKRRRAEGRPAEAQARGRRGMATRERARRRRSRPRSRRRDAIGRVSAFPAAPIGRAAKRAEPAREPAGPGRCAMWGRTRHRRCWDRLAKRQARQRQEAARACGLLDVEFHSA